MNVPSGQHCNIIAERSVIGMVGTLHLIMLYMQVHSSTVIG